jgi:hypothetical protein
MSAQGVKAQFEAQAQQAHVPIGPHVLKAQQAQPPMGVCRLCRMRCACARYWASCFYPRLVLAVPGSSAASAQVGTTGGPTPLPGSCAATTGTGAATLAKVAKSG